MGDYFDDLDCAARNDGGVDRPRRDHSEARRDIPRDEEMRILRLRVSETQRHLTNVVEAMNRAHAIIAAILRLCNEEDAVSDGASCIDTATIRTLIVTFELHESADAALAEIRDIVRGAFGPGTDTEKIFHVEEVLDEFCSTVPGRGDTGRENNDE